MGPLYAPARTAPCASSSFAAGPLRLRIRGQPRTGGAPMSSMRRYEPCLPVNATEPRVPGERGALSSEVLTLVARRSPRWLLSQGVIADVQRTLNDLPLGWVPREVILSIDGFSTAALCTSCALGMN